MIVVTPSSASTSLSPANRATSIRFSCYEPLPAHAPLASPPPSYSTTRRWEKCRSCVILPREEEGREELPAYQCTVYKMGHVFVKKERDAPGVRSRWRSWHWMYVELWGTLLRFYHAKNTPAHRWSHLTAPSSPFPTAKFLWPPLPSTTPSCPSSSPLLPPPPHRNGPLVATLNLAGAEAARALDYTKRPNALRLSIHQGPQFLFRLQNPMEMISWIEHLQAAINISMDLESRPMPKFMTLPGRLAAVTANDAQTLALEQLREQRYREHAEMLI
ncbi:PH domain-like protein [Hesseltinella vesiculosa]|uniref:PH domain-like protein n=1 Tax=Hesseltinella vesiculosa TaxID=101127 RepID=A0A1X2G6S6_9FUNG|nr:PH domain-like protein [Hesseltinella vesiculosa]